MEGLIELKVVCRHCGNDDQRLIKRLGNAWNGRKRYGCRKCKNVFYG